MRQNQRISAGQLNYDKGIEQVEANARNNEQVHGGDVRRVVTQEGAPALGRGPHRLTMYFATLD
jgi:hypothetical protein